MLLTNSVNKTENIFNNYQQLNKKKRQTCLHHFLHGIISKILKGHIDYPSTGDFKVKINYHIFLLP
jgi:hypothetical protein